MPSTLNAELAQKEKKVEETRDTFHTLRAEAQRYSGADLVAALREYDLGVQHRKPGFDADPVKHRALTEAICREVLNSKDIVFSSLGHGAQLLLKDLGPQRRADAAQERALEAQEALRAFRRENAEAFAAEVKADRQRALKAALADADTDRLRDILGVNEKAADTFTTADLHAG